MTAASLIMAIRAIIVPALAQTAQQMSVDALTEGRASHHDGSLHSGRSLRVKRFRVASRGVVRGYVP